MSATTERNRADRRRRPGAGCWHRTLRPAASLAEVRKLRRETYRQLLSFGCAAVRKGRKKDALALADPDFLRMVARTSPGLLLNKDESPYEGAAGVEGIEVDFEQAAEVAVRQAPELRENFHQIEAELPATRPTRGPSVATAPVVSLGQT